MDTDRELTTNQKGAIAESAIAAAATKAGFEVYRPQAEGGRFDMIFCLEGTSPLRVQCKWAILENGVVVVRTYSHRLGPHGYIRRSYTVDQIDALAAYCAENDTCFLLPAELVAGRNAIHLRVAPADNHQAAAITWQRSMSSGL